MLISWWLLRFSTLSAVKNLPQSLRNWNGNWIELKKKYLKFRVTKKNVQSWKKINLDIKKMYVPELSVVLNEVVGYEQLIHHLLAAPCAD